MLLHVVFVDLIDANSSCLLLISLTQSLDQLIENTVPSSIRMQRSMKMDDPVCKLTLRGFFFFKSRLSHKHQPFDEFIRHLFFFLFVKKTTTTTQTIYLIVITNCPASWALYSSHSSPPAALHGWALFAPLHEWLKCRLHLYCCAAACALLPPPPSLPVNIFGVVFAKLGERHQSPVGSRCS